MTALRQRLLDVFEVEHREHAEAIRRVFSKAEGERPPPLDLADATRRAHSLKGAARAVGLGEVETRAHSLESLLIAMERGENAFDGDARRRVFEMLDQIEDRIVPQEQAPLHLSGRGPAPSSGAEEAAGSAGGAERTRTDAESEQPAELVRVDAEDLDRLLRCSGELHADLLSQNANLQQIRAVSEKMAGLERAWSRAWRHMELAIRSPSQGGHRVAALGGDLAARIKTLSRDMREVVRRQMEGGKSFRRHMDELERRVMAARMMPAESVFGGFRRMVRDVASSEGKLVDVVVEGLECEADRLVLQRIKDPLMHLLRNAVSHGIELPEERKRAGKDPQGEVSFRVFAESDRLRITVEDDGRGIDFGRIADKAVEQKLLTREEADAGDRQSLCRLLFEPGFTTAESITTISGRGVGLSVARETISDLQGTIEITVRPAGGTRTEVSVPVSILARRLLLVSLKAQVFAVPCECVARVMRVALSDIATLEGRPVLRLKETTLPLTSIGELLNLGDTIVTARRDLVSIIVLRRGAAQVAVAVERFVGVNDFVIRPFETGSRRLRRWPGLITTEDGVPALVLNTDALLDVEFAQTPMRTTFQTGREDIHQSRTVLVVDDSITTRTLERSILEANGYRVRLSVDGRDALVQLRSELPDVVVSDIEMPGMDGFELLRAMKGDKRLSEVPVILVTSRSDAKDRERGLTLGAAAYVVKQRFDQNDLLQTIRQMV